MLFKFISAFVVAAMIAVGALVVLTVPVSAIVLPPLCDFTTGGGFVFADTGAQTTFGSHGGCKHQAFWGHVNYVDHGGRLNTVPYHVDSLEITGYFFDPADTNPNARHICGFARTNDGERVRFRVKMEDNGEPGRADRFGIRLSNGYVVPTRLLGAGGPGGGNVQLHKPNPSTTAPNPFPSIAAMCGGVPSPGA